MNRQKIGKILFWIGVVSIIVWQGLTWSHAPELRVNTAEDLSGTIYAVDGAMGFFRYQVVGTLGMVLPIIGVLLYTTKKGSYFWLLGFLGSSMAGMGMMWEPSQHMPTLFGIGGTVILLSYLGILWVWTRTYSAYEGFARTGRQIQILGYSFLFITGTLLCSYIGDPQLLALKDLPSASAESVNISLAFGMLLLFLGHYVVARGSTANTLGG
ncbi:MAG: hypothetical protein ACW97O_06400 [Candidatus Thorarchaeota archaeon]|jgi:hypothetical protein